MDDGRPTSQEAPRDAGTDGEAAPGDVAVREAAVITLLPVAEARKPAYPEWASAQQLTAWFGISRSNAHRWSRPGMKRRRPVPRRRGPNGVLEFEVKGMCVREKERQELLHSGHDPAKTLRDSSRRRSADKSIARRDRSDRDLEIDVETKVEADRADERPMDPEKASLKEAREEKARSKAIAAKRERVKEQTELERARIEAAQLAQDLLEPVSCPAPAQPVARCTSPDEEGPTRIARLNKRAAKLIRPATITARLDLEDRVERGELPARHVEGVLLTLKAEMLRPYAPSFPDFVGAERDIDAIARNLSLYVELTLDFVLEELGLRTSDRGE